ncbi:MULTISPECIES: hypothetical protein [Pseudomonas]|uniref:hypothetical protein n=1 Tax=Pseudomonas TaxID=286 RepID=UPI001FF54A8F|nr:MULTISPECIES: hypothetical protein [Pseudomonas]
MRRRLIVITSFGSKCRVGPPVLAPIIPSVLRILEKMIFIRNNKLFSCLYLLAVIITIGAVYSLGFGEAASQIATAPERLRSYTFPIWEQHAFSQHGFLVFYSMENYANKIAYSNHATAYLFYMYALYKVEMYVHALPMRVTGAFLNIISLAGVTFFFLSRLVEKRLAFGQGLLILLSVVFMVSMPGFWISSARFNVDNTFPLIFAFQAMAAFLIWRNQERSGTVMTVIVCFAVFSPISAALLGVALLVWACRSDGLDRRMCRLALVALVAAVAFYLPSPLISKALGFTSSNSGWLFRAGLDGDTSYFTNIVKSILDPQFPRPIPTIAVPILFLVAQLAYFRMIKRREPAGVATPAETSPLAGVRLFYYLLFSQYMMTSLLWPQAIAIHPYLYDYLLMAPVFVAIVLNFAFKPSPAALRFWALALLFCISFHLQQVAQAKCQGCYYPSAWDASGKHP